MALADHPGYFASVFLMGQTGLHEFIVSEKKNIRFTDIEDVGQVGVYEEEGQGGAGPALAPWLDLAADPFMGLVNQCLRKGPKIQIGSLVDRQAFRHIHGRPLNNAAGKVTCT